MTASIDVEDLKNLLLRMGQTGQPPERGAMRVNVGTDMLLKTLDREVLEPIRAYGPERLPDLQKSLAAEDFHIRKLVVEIVVASALAERKVIP